MSGPVENHAEDDGCAIYVAGYTVQTIDGDVAVENLNVGGSFMEYGEWWWVKAVATIGYDVHVDLAKVDDSTIDRKSSQQ